MLVNAAGKLIIDPSEILENTPTDGEVAKAPTSNWAYDHNADLGAHGGPGEGHITILPFNYNAIGQGTFVFLIASSSWGCGFYYNSSAADLDNISYQVYMGAGTYTLRILCMKSSAGAIVDIDIDGVEVASVDMYGAAPGEENQLLSATNIVVATAGLKTIRVRADGKNAGSSGYQMRITSITFWRTA